MAKNKKTRPQKRAAAAAPSSSAASSPFSFAFLFEFTPSSNALGRLDGLVAALVGIGVLGAYIPTISPLLLLEDDGYFLSIANSLGTAHPPGYPLYTLLLWAFMNIPGVSPAFGGHLLTAVLAALASGMLYFVARFIGLGLIPAVIAGLAFAFQDHIWSQAIRADVYTLNYLLVFAMIALSLCARAYPEKRVYWLGSAVIAGLALANHWPLFVLALPGILLIFPGLQAFFGGLNRGRLTSGLIAAFLALGVAGAFYVWLMYRSQHPGAVNFSYPLQGVDDFSRYLMRRDFAAVDNSPSAGWGDRLQFMGWFLWQSLTAFTLLGAIPLLIGAMAFYRKYRDLALALIAIWASQSLVLLLLLNFDYDSIRVAIFRAYPLVSFGILALWFAIGLYTLVSATIRLLRLEGARQAVFERIGVGVLGIGFLGFLLPTNFARNDLSDFTFAHDYAIYVLEKLPPDAELFLDGDLRTAAMAYYTMVEGMRPDLQMYHVSGLMFPNRLYMSTAPDPIRKQLVREHLATTQRPVYFLSRVEAKKWCPDCSLQSDGFVVRVDPQGKLPESAAWSQVDQDFLNKALSLEYDDIWVDQEKRTVMYDFGLLAAILQSTPGVDRDALSQNYFDPRAGPWAFMGILREIIIQWDPASLEIAREMIGRVEAYAENNPLDKSHLAEVRNVRGFLQVAAGDIAGGRKTLNESLTIWPHPDNEAHLFLEQLDNP